MKTTLSTDQLQIAWEQLDGACEALERLGEAGLLEGHENRIDFSAIVMLKNEVEELIKEQGKELSCNTIEVPTKKPFDVAALKKDLKEVVDGKFMVRRDRGYRGLEDQGIMTYNVYFDVSTPKNKENINETLVKHGVYVLRFLIIGGSYGYTIGFRTKN